MAYHVSPGIVVKEWDLTTFVPGVATTEAAYAGVFNWGPVEDAELITSEGELTRRYGRPTEDNFETFLIAANFLSYSNALYVSRAADANTFNAVVATSSVPNVQIKNKTDYEIKKATLPNDAVFYARYPGTWGNSLKISVCASADAYSQTFQSSIDAPIAVNFTRDSFEIVLSVTDAATSNTDVAEGILESIVDSLTIGDYVLAADPNYGTQNMKIVSIGSVTTDSATSSASVVLTSDSRFRLADDITMTRLVRYWEFFNLVDRAPGTSPYVAARGGEGDEMHIVVIDEDGIFTGSPNTVLEVFEAVSRATDAKMEGATRYYKDVIANSSTYIYAASDLPGAASGLSTTMSTVSNMPFTASFVNGASSETEMSVSLAALARAYDVFANPEEIDISLIIAGRAVGGAHGEGLANYIIDNIAEVRKDCIVTISPQRQDVVNNPYGEVEALVEFRHALRKSSYAFLTSAYKYQYDKYNDKYRWVAACGDDAGLMARTDKDRDPWWSPAGHSRGIYKNVLKLAFSPSKPQRDVLYSNDINAVVSMRGSGVILYGDKTLLGEPSAFGYINVRRLFIVLEKAIAKAAKALLFEFNDPFTRARFRNMVDPYLRNVQGRRGIIDKLVVCDETNNTPDVIDRAEFVGDIYIKPNRSINGITLNFIATPTGVEFNYVVGQFGG